MKRIFTLLFIFQALSLAQAQIPCVNGISTDPGNAVNPGYPALTNTEKP